MMKVLGSSLALLIAVLSVTQCHGAPLKADCITYDCQMMGDSPAEDAPVPEVLPEIEAKSEVVKSTDECAFVNLPAIEDLDGAAFEGIWYHRYRLKWSHHEFDSEINEFKDLKNGQISQLAKRYANGECETEEKVYTKSKTMPGEYLFDTFGGVKVLYADADYALVYVCDEVNKDGSCDREQMEVEVISRSLEAVSEETMQTLIGVIEGACLTKDDFEELTETHMCSLEEPVDCSTRPMCKMFCKNGFVTGEDGCPICKCQREAPVDCSTRPMCAMYCENGFVTGEDGCPVCECKEVETSGESSGEEESSGSGSGDETVAMVDGSGSGSGSGVVGFMEESGSGSGSGADTGIPAISGEEDSGEEEEVVEQCPLAMCMIECEFGMKTDENGCLLCGCNEAPLAEETPEQEAEVAAAVGGSEEYWNIPLMLKFFKGA